MTNQIQLTNDSTLFDYLTMPSVAGSQEQCVDNLATVKEWLKKITETIKEAEQVLASPEVDGVVTGNNYQLVTRQTSGQSEIYNPHKVWELLRMSSPELANDFLSKIKVTKKDVTEFLKNNNIKAKNFDQTLVIVEKEPTISYKLELKKINICSHTTKPNKSKTPQQPKGLSFGKKAIHTGL